MGVIVRPELPPSIREVLSAAGYDPDCVHGNPTLIREQQIEYAGVDYDPFFRYSMPGDWRAVPLPTRLDFGYWDGERIVRRIVIVPHDTPNMR